MYSWISPGFSRGILLQTCYRERVLLGSTWTAGGKSRAMHPIPRPGQRPGHRRGGFALKEVNELLLKLQGRANTHCTGGNIHIAHIDATSLDRARVIITVDILPAHTKVLTE